MRLRLLHIALRIAASHITDHTKWAGDGTFLVRAKGRTFTTWAENDHDIELLEELGERGAEVFDGHSAVHEWSVEAPSDIEAEEISLDDLLAMYNIKRSEPGKLQTHYKYIPVIIREDWGEYKPGAMPHGDWPSPVEAKSPEDALIQVMRSRGFPTKEVHVLLIRDHGTEHEARWLARVDGSSKKIISLEAEEMKVTDAPIIVRINRMGETQEDDHNGDFKVLVDILGGDRVMHQKDSHDEVHYFTTEPALDASNIREINVRRGKRSGQYDMTIDEFYEDSGLDSDGWETVRLSDFSLDDEPRDLSMN